MLMYDSTFVINEEKYFTKFDLYIKLMYFSLLILLKAI